jgi:hypothetical protein
MRQQMHFHYCCANISFQSLAYFYIRSLIHRPLLCHGVGSNTSASLITIADSAKHIVQILELLDERKMHYAFLMNRTELLLASGFSLLWHCMELSQDSKLAKDNQKSLSAFMCLLIQASPSIAAEFQAVAHSLVVAESLSPPSSPSPAQTTPETMCDRFSMPAPEPKPKSARRQLQAIASRFSSLTKLHQPRTEETPRRATVPTADPFFAGFHHRTSSQLSHCSTRSLPAFSITSPPLGHTFMEQSPSAVNLDYLSLDENSQLADLNPRKESVGPGVDWSQYFEGMDILSPIMYDGPYNSVLQDQISQSRLDLDVASLSNPPDWLDHEWLVSAIDLPTKGAAAQSVLSASEESITSGGDEFSGCGSNHGSSFSSQAEHHDIGSVTFRGIAMPTSDEIAT